MNNDNPLDRQVGGGHYKYFKIQPAEYINANSLDFFQGNVVKYVSRFKNKNGIEDLEKAKHYIEMLIKFEKGKICASGLEEKENQSVSSLKQGWKMNPETRQ